MTAAPAEKPPADDPLVQRLAELLGEIDRQAGAYGPLVRCLCRQAVAAAVQTLEARHGR